MCSAQVQTQITQLIFHPPFFSSIIYDWDQIWEALDLSGVEEPACSSHFMQFSRSSITHRNMHIKACRIVSLSLSLTLCVFESEDTA